MTYSVGDEVKWNWGNGEGKGTVQKVYKEKVTRSISGTEVTRDADKDNPAYYTEQSDGDHVLKSHSEVEKAG